MDPYGKGCYYNCRYCYAKQLLDFRKFWHPNDVGVAPIDKIERKIKKIPAGTVLRVGGMTDCFQPIESEIKNTYKTIELLNEHDIHYLIVTKSPLVATDEYMELFDKKLAHIQVSIPTDNNDVLNQTDNAENFEVRKNTIETLFKNNFDISLRLAPFLYETCDYDKINDIKVDKCLVEFLRVKPSMESYLGKIVDFDKFQLKEGGYRHLSLEEKLDSLDKLKFPELSVCDDVEDHYNYFQENINFNPEDCCNLTL